MKPLPGAFVALICVLAWATPAAAQQAPLGGGAWSWFGDPRAVHHAGKTYVGWVDLEGDIKVMSFDHTTEERVTAVLQARLNQDDHANPSIHVLEDGRLMVFYSRHVGPAMHYRISEHPGDVSSWNPPQTVPTNVAGNRGYTYPNPVHLAAENQTYLFWRGGNYNPTYSTQQDGSSGWSPARNLIHMPGERPYVKYASSGGDTIHLAYTNAHPNEFGDVNIYYARVRGGRIERADGDEIGTLAGGPIAPSLGDAIFDQAEHAWVHDVAADASGNPVIVFASFPSEDDHRYWYARWSGGAWAVHDITPAGGSFREQRRTLDYYSGGLTLDHEDPSRVYLSRQVGPGAWQVEAWTTANGGASWSSVVISLPETERNVRPVSPRGMPDPFDEDLRVIWMRGPYPNYEEYQTSITGRSGTENQPPVADAEPDVRSGVPPLRVNFSSFAEDPDGEIDVWDWDFGDGSRASGADVSHDYTAPGRYFPALTVTDNEGVQSTFVEEITVGLPAAPVTHTGGAAGSTVHGTVNPKNRPTRWYFEYGPTASYGAKTAEGFLSGGDAQHQIHAALPGLVPGRLYHYRLVAGNDQGTSEGEDRLFVAGSGGGSDEYADLVRRSGPAAYWRLGELAGNSAANELGGAPGTFRDNNGYLLGQVGVLGPLGNTAAVFDGRSGEVDAPGPALGTSGGDGTMEGWFRWGAGNVTMRDSTGPSRGWLLTLGNSGTLRYRVGGQGFDTEIPIEDVRDGTWHHLVATKNGDIATLYVDGQEVHSAPGADDDAAIPPWHIMRNGTNVAFSEGAADEVALYTRPLTAGEVRSHYDLAREIAARPLPPETPDAVVDPPAAGTGPGGGVLNPPQRAKRPAGLAFVRRGKLTVRGAPRGPNRLTARRRGRVWQVADAAARLRAGRGCRRLGPRKVTCRAAGVKRIEMYGGAGADTLAVLGRVRALLVGGPGIDRLSGGRLARFRGGPGSDRVRRLRP
jgi:PKD repeat protein